MNDALCLIPARGGSKRIPRKNIRPFAGAPMIAHSIRAAQACGLFKRIVVSTDCPEIAAIAREHGAETPFLRPPEIANDTAGTDAVIGHALDFFSGHGEDYRHLCCLYATAPFVTGDDLREGRRTLTEHGAATAFAVTSFPSTIFRALKLTADGRVEMFWPENFARRSQDFPEAFHDAGQFYWIDIARYRAERRLFSSHSVPVFIPRNRVQDIDTPEDWLVAEHLFNALRS